MRELAMLDFKTPADKGLIDALTNARMNGTRPDWPELEGDLQDALAAQLSVLGALQAKGFSLGGWKVGFTSGGGYDFMGAGFRPFGYVLKERTLASGAVLHKKPTYGGQVEPELCFEMGESLFGTDLPIEKCRAAVSAVRAAFEINETRVEPSAQPKLFLADGLANWGITVGSGGPPGDKLITSPVQLLLNEQLKQSSVPALVMDDPFLSLSRLCTSLARFGLGLLAGQYVITGSFFKHAMDEPGCYRAIFPGVGEVSLNVP